MSEKEKKDFFRDKNRKRRFNSRGRTSDFKPSADKSLLKIFDEIGVPKESPFVPDPFQLDAISAIENADCLVTAPTGSGKTWIAIEAIKNFQKKNLKSWYASPLKALSNSKYIEFSKVFGAENVGILTGDRKEKPDSSVVIGTTEILRNHLYDAMHHGETLPTDFVIIDEAHFLGDEERGVVWEEILIYLPPRIPILLLSATIGNAHEIAAWLSSIRGNQCIVIDENKRPVPLYPLCLHPSGTLYPLLTKGGATRKQKISKKVENFLDEYATKSKPPRFGEILQVLRRFDLLPAIFFLKSRMDCDNALSYCNQNHHKDTETKNKLKNRIQELTSEYSHISRHKHMSRLEHQFVASHHSGQLPAWKLVVENLMSEGLLDAVFATSTVAAGVNFPARTIVFLNSDKFNGTAFLPLTSTEFHQMTGRAGRRGMDNIGFAVMVPGKFMDIRLMAKLMVSEPSEVISQIKINFSMVLNLLLSHTLDQIEEILKKSFATYLLMNRELKESHANDYHKKLWQDFLRHLSFLKETNFVDEDSKLTEDGIWASKLRVDQPLMIAQGFRKKFFPVGDPAMLAAVMASFVNDKETDENLFLVEGKWLPNNLRKLFNTIKGSLKPFVKLMAIRGFAARALFVKPAVSVYNWALGHSWESVLSISRVAEGDLAMLILRTADNLRHIRALEDVFPEAAKTASDAIDLILKEPVINFD
ncbi:MAG: DEAD/DEAH box helicase [Desulfobacterales bacterium]|nr:DEAD/DEAH box helicase [Desulfobacterales bacterium]MBF0396095.1 DEAD/DEAH box helicase [Desulfobacterales bacterium]